MQMLMILLFHENVLISMVHERAMLDCGLISRQPAGSIINVHYITINVKSVINLHTS